MFYADYYILGQITEALTAPEDVSFYVCKEREVGIIIRGLSQQLASYLVFMKPLVSSQLG